MKAYQAKYPVTMLCRLLESPRAATTHGASARRRRDAKPTSCLAIASRRTIESLGVRTVGRNSTPTSKTKVSLCRASASLA
jgi:hypothetical protein